MVTPEDVPFTLVGFNEAMAQKRLDDARGEAERVALDTHGATVQQISPGALELACHSHATQLIGPLSARSYLERRAATHNRNWHPNLTPQEEQ